MMDDWDFARRAVDLAKQCVAEEGKPAPPKVAVVVVRDGTILGDAYRGQYGPGDHAEFCVLENEKKLKGKDLAGSTVYTTLEPCTQRGKTKAGVDKMPSAQRLIERKVAEVVVGLYDPNPVVYREGWRQLRYAGIRVRDFPADLRSEIRADNADFLDSFRWAKGESGTHTFDYQLNGGELLLGPPGAAIHTNGALEGLAPSTP
jgi:diaminohydroxyphosphoribosylaminopyrimidine deaminase/5-amino-6-(5-phosphoribosylamino)uracil reductase